MSWATPRLRTAVALLLILLQCLFPVAHGLVHPHGHAHGHVHGATAAAHADCTHACDGEGAPPEQPAAGADEDCAVCALLRLQPEPAPAPAAVAQRLVAPRPATLPLAHGPGPRDLVDLHRARGPPTAS
jgi:hypothetical protein